MPSQSAQAHQEIALRDAKAGLAKLGHAEPLGSIGEVVDTAMQIGGDLEALRVALQAEVARLESVDSWHPIRGQQVDARISGLLAVTKLDVDLLTTILRLDLDERRVRISEVEGRLVLRAVSNALAATVADQDLRNEIEAAVATELRAVEAGTR